MAEKFYIPKTPVTLDTLKNAKKIEIFELDREAGSKYGYRYRWTPQGVQEKEVNYDRESGTWYLNRYGEKWEHISDSDFTTRLGHVFRQMTTEPYEHWVIYVYPKTPSTMNGKYTKLVKAYKRML